MHTHPRKLLVVIAEAALEKPLTEDLKRLGAQGFTVHDVRGGGRRGTRAGDWEADRSIELKVIATEAVAQALADHVLAAYCPHYSVTMFLADAGVLRPEKFS
jgi:nitrogen regulatory protein P-II 2